MEETQVVIMAGGQGSRFWPISRMEKPKQFLSIHVSGESLIQSTGRRVESLSKRPPLVVTNVLHEALVKEHLPKSDLLVEPVGKNTAASIGFAAIAMRKKGIDPIMVVLPADHSVTDEEKLLTTLRSAIKLATQHEVMVTIGIRPSYPNTGYGYITQ